MENFKPLKELADKIQQQVQAFRDELRTLLQSQPDNPDATRLPGNSGAFTVPFSAIARDPQHTMSATYYDFKYQYRLLIDYFCDEKISTEQALSRIKQVLENGSITKYNAPESREVIRLHPTVMQTLQQLFESHLTDKA